MSDNYYQSGYSGAQIDEAIGRIINGEVNKLAANAANAASAAQSALKGVQTAIDNIPEGSTPIVNDLSTGGVSMALSAEMGKALGQRPNQNIVDNWYLLDPINQRGATEYTGAVYGIDRWRTNYAVDTVFITDNGVKNLNAKISPGDWHLHQDIEDVSGLIGHTVTASFLIADASSEYFCPSISFLDANSEQIKQSLSDAAVGLVTMSDKVPVGTTRIRIGFYADAGIDVGDYVTVKAVKLELGSVQTLAHQDDKGAWVLNDPPPNKQQELAKCQRYQYVANGYLSVAGCLTNNKGRLILSIPTPVSLRANPSVSNLTVSGIRTTAGSNITPTLTSFACDSFTPHGVNIRMDTAAFSDAAYTNNTPVFGYVRTVILDANL